MSTTKFKQRLANIQSAAHQVYKVCVDSQFNGTELIAERGSRLSAIEEAAAASPLFEGLGVHAGGVATAWGTALHAYAEQYGRMPCDDVLASAASALRNITSDLAVPGGNNKLLESVKESIETTQGLEFRARQAGLILPVMLACATADAVTYIPAG
ncbi:MAG: hypothetical protein ACRC9M_04105, partial [Aeromonas sp.]